MALDVERIRVVGFDLDQTLYPKSPEIDQAIQIYIYDVISHQLAVARSEAETMFNRLYQNGRGKSGSQTLAALGIANAGDVVQEALERADIDKFLNPDPEVITLLADLHAKYRSIDLLTGSNMSNCSRKLGKLALGADFFGVVITSDQFSKSTGEAYIHWMGEYPDLEPGNFLYVGDRVSTDHTVPGNLGIQTALVNISEQDTSLPCPQLPRLTGLRELLLD